jgi:hypothetical protein
MTVSARADSHCDPVMRTVEEALAVRQTETAACEDALTQVRDLLEVARGQALECGCTAAAENLATNIEKSKSTEYSCFNRSQGLGTLRGGIADVIQCSCYSC